MADLIASSLAVSFGTRPLFSDVSVTIDPGDRIALVGPNGAGKTTLLRVLSGRLQPSLGTVNVPAHVRVALHDQRPERSTASLRDHAAPPHMVALEARLRELELEMASGDEAVFRDYDKVRTEYDHSGGEEWVTRVESVLRGLGFEERQHDQPLTTLSGGELTRASLARALSANPDILLLDEPTNHLDLQAIDWLQEHIRSMRGGVVVVSHDRWFIESTCTSVIEVAGGKARRFNGTFVEYRAQQALEAVSNARQLERMRTEVARLQRFVDKFSAGTRSRQAQSRAKVLDKLRSDVPQCADLRSRRDVSFNLPAPERSGATVFDVRGLGLALPPSDLDPDGRVLLEPSDLVIERGDKIALLGRNGAGKSTLLHALAAACLPLMPTPMPQQPGGEIRVGYGVTARMLSQHDTELRDELSMVANLQLANPKLGGGPARSLLGVFGFTGDDGERLVSGLSGGERRRVLLAQALTGSANLLLIDEPTNHLDLEAREALESALAGWDGTLLLISHDRALIEGVATKTLLLHERRLVPVLGGYEAARDVLDGASEAAATPPPPPTPAARANGGAPRTGGNGGSRSKAPAGPGGSAPTGGAATPDGARSERRSRRGKGGGADAGTNGAGAAAAPAAGGGRKLVHGGKRPRRPGTIERDIETNEQELAAVQQRMLDPEIYSSPEASAEALRDFERLERTGARLYEELEASLAHFGG